MISILIALLVLAFVGHLLYARAHNTKPMAQKYPVKTEMYGLYSKLYTREFLVAALLIAFTSTFSAVLQVVGLVTGDVPTALQMLFLASGFITSMMAASILYELFKKKR